VILHFKGGAAGLTRALHRYQLNHGAVLDGLLLSNTWGDRSRAARLNESFALAEIRRGAELGIEVVQLDDGWQTGRTSNTVEKGGVWNGFWAQTPHFWETDPQRFPRGLGPLVAEATNLGLKLGLWFAPDSTDSFCHWSRDADVILGLWREHGIAHFKLDAIKLDSRLGEESLGCLLERLSRLSGGVIRLDLDLTDEARLGVWGVPDGATVFIENRYSDWGTYYPHATLRSLWTLSATVHPARLRMELLNPERNQEIYGSDPLAPAHYRADWLFASVMLSSPLAWFENTGLSVNFGSDLAIMIGHWKRHRNTLHGGWVQPFGECPNGSNLCGFAVFDQADELVHLLAFRSQGEANEVTWSPPPCGFCNRQLHRIAGTADLTLDMHAKNHRVVFRDFYSFGWWSAS